MLIALLALQSVVLIAVLALFLRKPVAAESDPRLGELGDKFNRLDLYLREALAQCGAVCEISAGHDDVVGGLPVKLLQQFEC